MLADEWLCCNTFKISTVYMRKPRESITCLSLPWKQQRADRFVCYVVCLSHNQTRPGVSKVPLEREASCESRAAEHGHQIRRDAHTNLCAQDFRLQERRTEVARPASAMAAAACKSALAASICVLSSAIRR